MAAPVRLLPALDCETVVPGMLWSLLHCHLPEDAWGDVDVQKA